MNQHSKDYLQEYAATAPYWLQNLIIEAIATNGKIDSAKLSDVYNMVLANDNNKTVPAAATPANHSDDRLLVLKQMTHEKGVNALKYDESFKFSPHCTVLFGLNGSGKSGYFRILNEIAGGNQKKEILKNIYSPTGDTLSAKIEYEYDGAQLTMNWNNQARAIAPFNRIKVFDSSYLDGLLSKRGVDETLVQPFGLHLFSYIIAILDNFKAKLAQEATSKKNQQPSLALENLSEPLRTAFQSHSVTVPQMKSIRSLTVFNPQEQSKLTELENEIRTLQQTNIEDRIKIETQKKTKLAALKKSLSDKRTKLVNELKSTQLLLATYKTAKASSDAHKKQISILETLPGSDSKAWKDFISAADLYATESGIPSDEKICVYCRQPLDANAIKLVQAYGDYLGNDSKQKLDSAISAIKQKKDDLAIVQTGIAVDADIQEYFQNTAFNAEKSLSDALADVSTNFSEVLSTMKKKLDEHSDLIEPNILPIEEICTRLQTEIDASENKIKGYQSSSAEKTTKIQTLQQQAAPLREKKSLTEQKVSIEKWLALHLEEKELNKKRNEIKTRPLTDLSGKAHNELLTENLKSKFSTELANLGFLASVELQTAGTSKGIPFTVLTITNTNHLRDVLSEGEQKTVALALFLAESMLQNQKNPIILDDPVNSLDHKIAARFAERLLELESQVVVFTHKKLFLDAFETSNHAHICKNMSNGCNSPKKHIFLYTVQSEGISRKGVIVNRKANKAKTHLETAKQHLLETPFVKHLDTATALRKTVECMVDEKVFNNQTPTKLSTKNNRIHWDSLKNMCTDANLIDVLHRVHDRVSGGMMHNGVESEENPIEVDEFNQMVSELQGCIGQ
ncbi:MAG: hypothetical protein JXR76_11325 [Deltaproteobacteria bacterium]|nr:hypothetical protein [Deltaproteobacteria bacterium]